MSENNFSLPAKLSCCASGVQLRGTLFFSRIAIKRRRMKQVSPWRNWRRRVRQWQCQKNPLHKKWKLPDRTFHNSGVAETVDRRTLLFRTFNRQSLKLWNCKAFRRLLPSNLNGRQTSVRFFFLSNDFCWIRSRDSFTMRGENLEGIPVLWD